MLDDVVYQQAREEIAECANAEEFPVPSEMQHPKTIEQKRPVTMTDMIVGQKQKESLSAGDPDWA